jgi:hypothetical protein
MARMIGQLVVEHGPAEAGKVLDEASKKARSRLSRWLGLVPGVGVEPTHRRSDRGVYVAA